MTPIEVLKKYFGYDSFRPGQEKIIHAILERRKVLAIMPTGAGKSLCFQVPALLFPYGTIVISPLISLMKDQVETLSAQGVPATFVNSSISYDESIDRLRKLYRGDVKILYMAPERLRGEHFVSCLKKVPLSMVVIDEAHCVSQWGHDFRPSYGEIRKVVAGLSPSPVVTAFTATATPLVEEDMKCLLGLSEAKVFRTDLDRPNLSFRVFRHMDKENFVISYVKNHRRESGIIYCATRKAVEEVYETLQGAGLSVGRYHAGMSDAEREKAQDDFSYDRVAVMVATNAFGMGIDKSNVRYVIHYQMPKSPEAYYQEAGRAGRDGAKAECILLYSTGDYEVQRYLIEVGNQPEEQRRHDYERLHAMERYAETSGCLRNCILEYFGEHRKEACGHCGNCENAHCRVDITDVAGLVFRTVRLVGAHFGASIIAHILKGSHTKVVREKKLDRVLTYGRLRSVKIAHIRDLIASLSADGYLRKNKDYGVVELTAVAEKVLAGKARVEGLALGFTESVMADVAEGPDVPRDLSLFDALRELRSRIAKDEKVPPFVVFSDATLEDMIRVHPLTKEDMGRVHGVGAFKLQKYGARFLEIFHEKRENFVSIHKKEDKNALRERLERLRRLLARERKVAPRQIVSDAILEAMVNEAPASLADLRTIKGMGPKKIEAFGLLFLSAIQGDMPTVAEIKNPPADDVAEKAFFLYLSKVRTRLSKSEGKGEEEICSMKDLRRLAKEKRVPADMETPYREAWEKAIGVYETILEPK